jgi:hypothetical protein
MSLKDEFDMAKVIYRKMTVKPGIPQWWPSVVYLWFRLLQTVRLVK